MVKQILELLKASTILQGGVAVAIVVFAALTGYSGVLLAKQGKQIQYPILSKAPQRIDRGPVTFNATQSAVVDDSGSLTLHKGMTIEGAK